ncbi:MAG: acyltransferase family protein [Bacteroidales bacterium]|nr:acyltransferase family protein [Bacteroidales bacterium]
MTREVWLDFLRVTACFLVMVVHGTEPFYLGGDGTLVLTATDAYWVSAFEALARCCVPVFLIASSYLQFPLHYATADFFKRRAVRILIPMLVWTLVYALVWGEPAANLKGLLLNFNYAAGHLWFVYMLLGIYLLMPLLSPWAEKVSRRELEVYLGIWLVTTLLPFVREAAGGQPLLIFAADGLPAAAQFPLWGEASWNPYGTFYYLSGFIGYLMVGLYIRKFLPCTKSVRYLGWTLFLLGFLAIFSGFLGRMSASSDTFPIAGAVNLAVGWEAAIAFCGLPVVLSAVGLTLAFRHCHSERSEESPFYRHLVLPLSKAGYGMYLCHMLVLAPVSAFFRSWLGLGTEGVLGGWTTPVQILGTALCSFALVGLAACLLQRIPHIGKYLMG